jgi:hypothetical protein
MSRRVAQRVVRPQAQQTHRQAQLDAAAEPAAERAGRPGAAEEAAAGPEINWQTRTTGSRSAGALSAVDGSDRHDGDMNRSERIGFWMYVAMGIFCAAVLVAAAIAAIAS